MTTNLVNYKAENNYCIITLNNGKANAISHEVIDQLNTALDQALTEKKIVILTGSEGMFSGGYDLKVMTQGVDAAKELVTRGSQLTYKMLSFPLPIIIACSGHAIAKGAFLLLASDYRLGVEGNFKIGLNEVIIGMTMHQAGIELAKARLAPVFFERSVNNAEIYNPQDAVTAGFLDKLVPQEHLLSTAIKIAEMFTQLNLKAHEQTKLKVRAPYLTALKNAIEKDLTDDLTINPKK